MRYLAATLIFLTACSPVRHVTVRPNFAYVETEPGVYAVFVPNQKALDDAKKQLGCGVCAESLRGYVYLLTVPKRK